MMQRFTSTLKYLHWYLCYITFLHNPFGINKEKKQPSSGNLLSIDVHVIRCPIIIFAFSFSPKWTQGNRVCVSSRNPHLYGIARQYRNRRD